MVFQVIEENGQKKIQPLTSDARVGNPLGTIIAVYSNHCPVGYLPCNGVAFDQTQYPALYALLGDNHTPDLRNKALMGANPSSQDTPASGNTSDVGDVQKASAPNITGSFNKLVAKPSGSGAFYASGWGGSAGVGGNDYNGMVFDASRSGASSDHLGNNVYGAKETTDTGTELRPANVRINYCIKAVPGIEESQADYVGDIIKDYVDKKYFPDYARGSLYTTADTSYTMPEDGYVVYSRYSTSSHYLLIDGVVVSATNSSGSSEQILFTGFAKKGSVITVSNNSSIPTSAMKVFGLTV